MLAMKQLERAAELTESVSRWYVKKNSSYLANQGLLRTPTRATRTTRASCRIGASEQTKK